MLLKNIKSFRDEMIREWKKLLEKNAHSLTFIFFLLHQLPIKKSVTFGRFQVMNL